MPPPYGGVSIHLQRLSRLLSDEYEFDFVDEARMVKKEFFNLRSLNLLRYYRKLINSDLIYIHSGTSLLKIFHVLSGRLFCKRTILTIHAYPKTKPVFPGKPDRLFFRLADTIIAVNSEIAGRINLPSNKCLIMNAFIPPLVEEEAILPSYLSDWINVRKKNDRVIVCTNAYRLETFNNQDLYGLDLCIEAARSLSAAGTGFSFIFNVSVLDDYEGTYNRYREIIRESDMQDNFLLINENLSFVRLMEHSDIVLRPTNTDGDSLTVREAIYLGKKVIASDVVTRPAGTLLFRSRDADDLADKLTEAATNRAFTPKEGKSEIFFKTLYSELIEKIIARNQ